MIKVFLYENISFMDMYQLCVCVLLEIKRAYDPYSWKSRGLMIPGTLVTCDYDLPLEPLQSNEMNTLNI